MEVTKRHSVYSSEAVCLRFWMTWVEINGTWRPLHLFIVQTHNLQGSSFTEGKIATVRILRMTLLTHNICSDNSFVHNIPCTINQSWKQDLKMDHIRIVNQLGLWSRNGWMNCKKEIRNVQLQRSNNQIISRSSTQESTEFSHNRMALLF